MFRFVRHHRILTASTIVVIILLSTWFVSRNQTSIEYVAPRYGPIVEAIYGLGKVKTDRIYEVKLSVVKTVEQLFVKEGDQVSQNDRLVRMQGDLLFRAPFAGTITQIAFHEAQSVFPQQTVLRLEDLTRKFIEVSLEQQGALRIKRGQSVRVLFESVRGEQLQGKVAAIFSRNEEFLAHIEVAGLDENVLPGMTADVAIEVGRKEKALLIPLAGVADGRVRIQRGDKKQVVQIGVGNIDGNWAEVTEGDIQPTDLIIIRRK